MTTMKLLVLGGTHFVGRAIVEAAVTEGMDVTTLNRGRSAIPGVTVRALVADRTDPAALRAALGDGEWDAVIDTWSDAPLAVATACGQLKDRTGHFGYVSTISVYAEPVPAGADETAPVVDADPDSPVGIEDISNYAAAKRGGELAVLRAFGDGALIARPGLILGPYENVGRLPWWLRRIERGGRVLAPGDPDKSFQYVDARDLASWMLAAASDRTGGAFNLVNRPGATTIGELLDLAVRVTGSKAELVWTPQERVLEAGISPWTELPIWVPRDPEYDAMETMDTSAAIAAGFTSRPLRETVADTWAWLQVEGDPAPRLGRTPVGLDPAKEEEVLSAANLAAARNLYT
jgi:nucleoside-diphosphate-sugar epimerase